VSGFVHEAPGGGSAEWYTPAWVFDALGVTFDLDPCSPLGGPNPYVPARRFYTAREDGLTQPWEGRVWLNPPYGDETAKWVGRLSEHGDGLALVFARTDTRWAQAALRRATAVCFIAGRVAFIAGGERSEVSTPAAPSMLLAYGAGCAAALVAADMGVVVKDASEPRQMGLAA
jgi:hypothetical protein